MSLLLVASAVIIVSLFQVLGFFDALELKTYDLRFRLRGAVPAEESPIVLVAIDDQSFKSLQTKWPFPRSYFARVINNLAEAGAALIILDVEFIVALIEM